MVEYKVISDLTVLAIGLTFGFMIGMLWYYPEIQNLKNRVRKFFKK